MPVKWRCPAVIQCLAEFSRLSKEENPLATTLRDRRLNKMTHWDVRPMPPMFQCLRVPWKLFQGSAFSPSLNLRPRYWQTLIAEDHKGKTGFATSDCLYAFSVMPTTPERVDYLPVVTFRRTRHNITNRL